MKFPGPDRVWEQTPNGKWTSREWAAGEKAEYHQTVGYEPPVDNGKEIIAKLCELWGQK